MDNLCRTSTTSMLTLDVCIPTLDASMLTLDARMKGFAWILALR